MIEKLIESFFGKNDWIMRETVWGEKKKENLCDHPFRMGASSASTPSLKMIYLRNRRTEDAH